MLSGRIRPKLVLPAKPTPQRFNEESFGPHSAQRSGFIKNAYYNGLGRQVNQLARVTIKFSQTSGISHGVREFVELKLIDFCRKNPGISVYLKPRFKPTPILLSEYLNGSWHWFNLGNMAPDQVTEWLNYFVERSGEPVKRFRKPIHTDWPTIQGVWTPFTYLPPELAFGEWPNKQRGEFKSPYTSGTEHILKLQESNEKNASHIIKQHSQTD